MRAPGSTSAGPRVRLAAQDLAGSRASRSPCRRILADVLREQSRWGFTRGSRGLQFCSSLRRHCSTRPGDRVAQGRAPASLCCPRRANYRLGVRAGHKATLPQRGGLGSFPCGVSDLTQPGAGVSQFVRVCEGANAGDGLSRAAAVGGDRPGPCCRGSCRWGWPPGHRLPFLPPL